MSVPHLNELYDEFAGQGLLVLGITKEKREPVANFVQRNGVKYPIGLDDGGRTNEDYGIRGIPSAFLVNAEGKVVWQGHPMGLEKEYIKSVVLATARAARSGDDSPLSPGPDPRRAGTRRKARAAQETGDEGGPKREPVSPETREIRRLFSLGKTWLANRDVEKAKEYLQTLAEKYPDAPEAATARQWLEQLR